MNVNIYYGGRGMVDDPTIVVINRIQEVLEELNVTVTRYNLYEMKNTITTLSQSVADADGVIFATTVEWVGMGGYMQTLLDSCWLYADKSKAASTYMFPVVMSRAYGEREVVTALCNSWEIIGGVIGSSLSAYVDDTTDFEFNQEYKDIIEKYAENIYRTISKKVKSLPSSSQTIRKNVIKEVVSFTPQESEQLSKYASDDEFVKTQKEDIESLASIYKELMNDQANGGDDYYLSVFRNHFKPELSYNGRYMFMISDKHPPELPSSTTRLPKGHKASIANFKVWRPKGIPMIVIISIRLDIRYSTLVIIPPKSNHIIFPKNFIR